MTRFLATLIAATAIVFLSGCISPEDYETTPVEVSTPQGIVTCQLYLHDRVIWDRAIHRPETMSVAAADAACVAEGKRRAGQV